MSETVTVPVAEVCEYNSCNAESEFAYIVTGDYGKDGIAVYCDEHSESWADPSENQTPIAEVNHEQR